MSGLGLPRSLCALVSIYMYVCLLVRMCVCACMAKFVPYGPMSSKQCTYVGMGK